MKRTTLALVLVLALSVSGLAVVSEASLLEWSKTYGYIHGVSIVQTEDDNLVIAAKTGTDWYYARGYSFDYENRTGALFEIDLNGTVQWRTQLAVTPVASIETEDGGFAVAGWTRRLVWTDAYAGRVYSYFISLAETDSQGNILWSRTYENLTEVIPNSMQSRKVSVNSAVQTSDGGFVLGGCNSSTSYKAMLIKTDSVGNIEWIKNYGKPQENYSGLDNSVQAIVETADKGFLFVGYLDGALIVKTDSAGNVEWTKTYDDETEFYSIIKTEDEKFVMAGFRGENPRYAFSVKMDAAFNTVWNKTFGGYSVFSVKDSVADGYLFTNSIYGGDHLVKTDLEGNIEGTYKSKGSIWSAIQTKDGKYVVTGSIKNRVEARKTGLDGDITDIMVERFSSLSRYISEPLPIVAIAAAVVIVVAVICAGLGLLIYLIKRK
jgi:hypothetical protein